MRNQAARKIFILGSLLAIAGMRETRANTTLNWGTGSGTYIITASDSSTRLAPYSQAFSASDVFVQLILANGSIHEAGTSGNGTTGGDTVLATSWMGRGFFSSSGGEFDGAALSESLAVGSKLYIRAWNAASPDYTGGAAQILASVPTGGSVRYGNSLLYTTTSDPLGPPASETFALDNVGAGFSTTLVAVPEPGTWGLMVVGLVLMGCFRKLAR